MSDIKDTCLAEGVCQSLSVRGKGEEAQDSGHRMGAHEKALY